MIGKPKTFKTPDDLWNYFLKYVEYVKNNPLLVHDYVGKDGNSVYREKQRPLTFQGFEVWLSQEGVIKYPDLTHYCEDKDSRYTEYVPITRAIKKACSVSRIEGAMAGIFNANLAARLDGLNDEEKKDKPGYTIPQITIKYESNGTGTGTAQSEVDGE